MQGAELGSPGIDKGSRSPRHITQLKVGLRQLIGKRQKKHKKRRGGETSFLGTRGSKKCRERRVTIHNASERYLGELEWEDIKREVAAKTFEPAGIDSTHLGKMTKKKDGQKNWIIRGFEEQARSGLESQPWAFKETESNEGKYERTRKGSTF